MLARLQKWGQAIPERVALCDDSGQQLTYRELYDAISGNGLEISRQVSGNIADVITALRNIPLWVGQTSGTTSAPRAIIRDVSTWVASFNHTADLQGIRLETNGSASAGIRIAIPGNIATSLYAYATFQALYIGAEVVFMPTVVASWSEQLSNSSEPTHLQCSARQSEVLAQRLAGGIGINDYRFESILVGGSELRTNVRQELMKCAKTVVSYYGASELSYIAFDSDGQGLRAFPEVKIRIIDGEIMVKSPYIAKGYQGGNGQITELQHVNGWYGVGDMGSHDGRLLEVYGRGQEAVTCGSATILISDVENGLRAGLLALGIQEFAVFGQEHKELGQIVACAMVAGETSSLSRNLSLSRVKLDQIARKNLPRLSRPRRWYAIKALPRTATGKVQRNQLNALVVGSRLEGGPDSGPVSET